MTQLKSFLILLIIGAAFNSCSTTKVRVIGTWVNKEKVPALKGKVTSVFITVMTQNEVVKSVLENDLADAAAAKGIKSVKSYYVFGPVRTKENLPPKDLVLKNIRSLGCNVIFTVVLLDQTSETRYVQGSGVSVYAPYPHYGYYGNFGSYYGYSSTVYTPGYYTEDKTYYIESNLYDANTEELLVSMQTKVANPSEIEKSGKQYTKALIQELENQGLLKK